MKLKFIWIIIVIVTAGFLLAGCSSGTQQQASQTTATQQASTVVNTGTPAATANTGTTAQKTFTAAELSKFNGKNGNPAYVAVNGVVYDLSNVPQWRDGEHNGLSAGKDLTKEFETKSPHGASIFEGIPVVGKYVG